MNLPEYVTINGTSYSSAKLSDAAKAQIVNVQIVDAEIVRLNQQLAIAQTARSAYSNALIAEVKGAKDEAPAAKAPKKPRAPAKKKVAAEATAQ